MQTVRFQVMESSPSLMTTSSGTPTATVDSDQRVGLAVLITSAMRGEISSWASIFVKVAVGRQDDLRPGKEIGSERKAQRV